VTLAEPGALIGFLGPRAAEAITGRPFPPGVQTAENLHAHGIIDAVVALPALGGHLAGVLDALGTPSVHPPSRWAEQEVPSLPPCPLPGPVPAGSPGAWECVQLTRASGHRAAHVLREAAPRLAVLGEAGGLLLAAGQLGRARAVVVAQDGVGALGIDGLRLARRGMLLAAELELPLVTMIDTPGGELSAAAEEGGIAREIAQTLELLVGLPVPTVAVLLGQGAGGSALALLPADRILADWCAWLAPLAPEGASAIVYRDTAHAPELARAQGIRAVDLAAMDVVDEVAPNDLDWPTTLAETLIGELAALTALGVSERLGSRRRRLRALGIPPR
jgi:acetyl-CoA carboxylase carboxyl transferase subunit beta